MKTTEITVKDLGLEHIGQVAKVSARGYTHYGVIKSFMLSPSGYAVYIDKHIVGPLEESDKVTLLVD